jgi:hypothetical protein
LLDQPLWPVQAALPIRPGRFSTPAEFLRLSCPGSTRASIVFKEAGLPGQARQ